VTAEDGGMDVELIEQPREVAAMSSDRVAPIGRGFSVTAQVIGECLPTLKPGEFELTAPVETRPGKIHYRPIEAVLQQEADVTPPAVEMQRGRLPWVLSR